MAKASEHAVVLYQALSTRLGLVVEALPGERDKLRQQLYQARTQAGDEELACLQFRFSPSDPNQILIIKGDTTL